MWYSAASWPVWRGPIFPWDSSTVLPKIWLRAGGMLAVIAVKMGRWNPVGVLCAALLFGFFDALQLQFQIQQWVAIPTELVQMIPLAAGMVALALSSGENATPRAFGKPYVRRRD